jgi:hypothetical protein
MGSASRTISEKLFAVVLALFFPVSGLGRAIDATMSRVTLVVAFGKVFLVIGHDKNTRADASSTCFALNDLPWENATLRGKLYAISPFRKFFRLNQKVCCPSEAICVTVQGDYSEIRPRDLRWSRNMSKVASQQKLSGYRIMDLPSTSAAYIEIPLKEDAKLQIPQSLNLLVTFIAVLQILDAAY